MCGILGFNWKDDALAKRLCTSLKHRGPDQKGLFSDETVTLGHTRLSILDLSERGKQPMFLSDKSLAIVFNGEIFNYQELKKEFPSDLFISTSDTEVILHAYKKYGVDCVNKLNGQFAFCIYDAKKKLLFLARDRLGINPLYYYLQDGRFIFGSELKTILSSGIQKEINSFALRHYLAYGYTPQDQSIIQHAHKLKPGHYLLYDLVNKTASTTKYWNISPTTKITDEAEAIHLLQAQLERSVKDRLVADVPVGAFLSGGLDSSAVVAYASKYKKEINTFSVSFDNPAFDEQQYSSIVARHFKTKHHILSFGAKDVKQLLKQLPFHYDDPFADPSMVPTFFVSKVARQHVTVSLSGDGGDELFGGYNSYNYYHYLQIQNYYPRFLNKLFYSVLKHLPFRIFEKPRAFFEIGCLPYKHKYARLLSYLTRDEFIKLTRTTPDDVYEHHAVIKENYLSEATNQDIHNYLPDDILTKVDRASLANSLESRPPILDHELVELALRISPKLKIKGTTTKYIFKKAMEGIVPREIIYRKKQGFAMPLASYLQQDLRQIVYKYVFNFTKHNLFEKEFLQQLETKYGKAWDKDYSRIIWTLLMFNLWWEQWM